MDDPRTDLVLKELKRIKWLLVLIVVAFLSVTVSFLYIGWEVASLLQEKPDEDGEGTVETMAEDLERDHPEQALRAPGQTEQSTLHGNGKDIKPLPENVRGRLSGP